MATPIHRHKLEHYIRVNAKPPDKFSHQARLHRLAVQIAGEQSYDGDVLHAAAWLHDLGVFIGHRPDDPARLAAWDHLAYVLEKGPAVLRQTGFPEEKIPAVLEAIRTHQPKDTPKTLEGVILRDADILEQLGAVGILRSTSKVDRDTRFTLFSDALKVLHRTLSELPALLKLEKSRELAVPRVAALKAFLAAADAESLGLPW